MADPDGFLKHKRQEAEPPTRAHAGPGLGGDVRARRPSRRLRVQASRCMDCAIPFLQQPERVPAGQPRPGLERPRLPGPLAGRHRAPARHQQLPRVHGADVPGAVRERLRAGHKRPARDDKADVEKKIIDYAWEHGWVTPVRPSVKTAKRVAVVGSGPAGMAAAQQLTRAGHDVVVYERDDRPGGLVRYGIPDFKMDKALLDRRVEQMEAEGTVFECGVDVGVDLSVEDLRSGYDAVVLAIGALWQRDLEIPGRHLDGVHLAMDYLVPSNRVQAGLLAEPPIDAAGKKGDNYRWRRHGADCLGTAHRQGAASVHQFDIHERPPDERPKARRGRCGPWCCGAHWLTRRGANASSPSRPTPSWATAAGVSVALVRIACGS